MGKIVAGRMPDGSYRYAAVDEGAHHVGSAVSDRKFAAWLSPYRDPVAATAALADVGAIIEGDAR